MANALLTVSQPGGKSRDAFSADVGSRYRRRRQRANTCFDRDGQGLGRPIGRPPGRAITSRRCGPSRVRRRSYSSARDARRIAGHRTSSVIRHMAVGQLDSWPRQRRFCSERSSPRTFGVVTPISWSGTTARDGSRPSPPRAPTARSTTSLRSAAPRSAATANGTGRMSNTAMSPSVAGHPPGSRHAQPSSAASGGGGPDVVGHPPVLWTRPHHVRMPSDSSGPDPGRRRVRPPAGHLRPSTGDHRRRQRAEQAGRYLAV